jgi:hypothetical protein
MNNRYYLNSIHTVSGFSRLGQGSKSERRIAITDFLLKWSPDSGGGQAAEPPAVGPGKSLWIKNEPLLK